MSKKSNNNYTKEFKLKAIKMVSASENGVYNYF